MYCNGSYINIFDNADDFDFSSLYPSELRQFNISCHTQIGMIIIKDQVHAFENRRHSNQYIRGGAFLEDMAIQNWIDVGSRWFGLLDFGELVKFVKHMCMTEISPMYYHLENSIGTMRFPIVDMSKGRRPIIIKAPYNEQTMNFLKEWRVNVENSPNQSF